jgi:hypothetical protein
VPDHPPLVAALTPDPLPAKDGGWLILAGMDDAMAPTALDVHVEGATLKPVPPETRARYAVTPLEGASEVSATVRLRGAADADATRIHAGVRPEAPPPPEPVVIVTPPTSHSPRRVIQPSHGVREHTSLFLLGGAAFASGANGGPLLGLGVSVPLPVWDRRLAAEVEAGLRHARLDGLQGTTRVHSRVWGIPLLLSARVTLFQRGSFTLDGRAGGGALVLDHRLTTEAAGTGGAFPGGVDERKVRAMGFLSAQGAYDLGRWSILTEVRAAVAPVETPTLRAELGGVSVSAGLRFAP